MIKRRSIPRRVSVPRDEAYLQFLRDQGWCVAGFVPCYKLPVDPAHGKVNGMSSKGSDLEAIPLCRIHHEEMEKLRWPAFCAKYGMDRPVTVTWWNERYRIHTAAQVNTN